MNFEVKMPLNIVPIDPSQMAVYARLNKIQFDDIYLTRFIHQSLGLGTVVGINSDSVTIFLHQGTEFGEIDLRTITNVSISYLQNGTMTRLWIPKDFAAKIQKWVTDHFQRPDRFEEQLPPTYGRLVSINKPIPIQNSNHIGKELGMCQNIGQIDQSAAHDRKTKIQEFCLARGIKSLFHFTSYENLKNIFEYGLLSRKCINESYSNWDIMVNDQIRADYQPDATCLSISFPNYLMFSKYRSSGNKNWVVLRLEARILWELDCAFCEKNAANSSISSISIERRKLSSSFEKMYSENFEGRIRSKIIPDCYPTHPQAEVLVFEKIPPSYIDKIYFNDSPLIYQWINENPDFQKQKLEKSEKYFSSRKDHKEWTKRNSD